MLFHIDGEFAKRRRAQRLQQKTAVGVRIHPHAKAAFWREIGKFGEEYRIPREDLLALGFTPAEPGDGRDSGTLVRAPAAAPPAVAPDVVPLSLYNELLMKHEQILVQYGMIRAGGQKLLEYKADAESKAEEIRDVGVHLMGRRLYETMLYWETADQDPSLDDLMIEWGALWRAIPKVVFSTTLERVEDPFRLVRENAIEEVARLKSEPGKQLAVGGAGLAATCVRAGLVDEYRMFVFPVLLGAGTPYLPALDEPLDLRLVETRTFGSRVVYLHYRATRA